MGEAGWPFSQEAFLESDAWFEVRVLAIKAEVRHLHYKKENIPPVRLNPPGDAKSSESTVRMRPPR